MYWFYFIFVIFNGGGFSLLQAQNALDMTKNSIESTEPSSKLIVYEYTLPQEREKEISIYNEIFDPKITPELKKNYEEMTGLNLLEQKTVSSKPFEDINSKSEDHYKVYEEQNKQRQFGEFMFAKLTEYHIDKYTNENPKLQTVQRIKQRLSKVHIQSKQGYGVHFQYSLSRQYVNINMTNPLNLIAKMTLSSQTGDKTLNLGYVFNPQFNLNSYYSSNNGTLSFVTENKITESFSNTITTSAQVDRPNEVPDEKLILFGFTYLH